MKNIFLIERALTDKKLSNFDKLIFSVLCAYDEMGMKFTSLKGMAISFGCDNINSIAKSLIKLGKNNYIQIQIERMNIGYKIIYSNKTK